MARTKTSTAIYVQQCETESYEIWLVGRTPLIMNRMSEKARRQLLVGTGRKTAAEKAGQAKHDPYTEFRDSPYRMRGDDAPTVLGFPPGAFKAAMQTAALETPGAKKAQVGRLVSVPIENVPIYGVPQIICSITRSADINRTPDVRTRLVVPRWATLLPVTFVAPTLSVQMITTLLANAGVVCGVGDWRQERGSGSFGSFRVANGPNDPELREIVESGGRDAQLRALEDPEPFDDETRELLGWFDVEVARRGLRVAA